MFSVNNLSWLHALAAALPNTTVENGDQPYFLHNSGLTFSVSDQRDRYMFSIHNLHAVNSTGVQCPIAPPRPITVDRHRTTAKIAAEVHRRLLLPGLQWLPNAQQWQQKDNEAYTAQRLLVSAFVAAGGHPHRDYSTRIDGHRWHAQVDSAESVTLHLTSLPPEKALAIVQLLTA